MPMYLFLFFSSFLVSYAAPAKDEVLSLPGLYNSFPSRQFSGYLNISNGKHVHYWFVESEGNPSVDPVALWVQGGPGGSSMTGMWTENMGPFALDADSLKMDPPTLKRSQYPWTAAASMLFWEAPAGVGFSYCEGECPHYNDEITASDNAETICAWFDKFPEFGHHPFFIVGESYAGVYIPTVVLQLLDTGMCDGRLQLKGIMIGNGCTGTDAGTCSPGRHKFTVEQLFQQAMISQKTKASIDVECADSMGFRQPSPTCEAALKQADDEAGAYNNYNVHDTCGPPKSTLASSICTTLASYPGGRWACEKAGLKIEDFSGKPQLEVPITRASVSSDQPENYFCGGDDALITYLSRADVQMAIHVREQSSWPSRDINYTRSAPNLLKSPGYPDIIAKGIRTLIYSGDFDAQIPHCGTEDWTRGFNYPVKAGTKYYRPWLLEDGQVAGRLIEYDAGEGTEFMYATVAGAGHMVPTFKPREGFELFRRFIQSEPLQVLV